MEEVFNNEAHYFLAEENGNIAGILPLIHIKSLIFGHYLTSLPGGLCADNDVAAALLLDRAKEFVKASKAKYLILRDQRRKWKLPELITDEEHVTFLIEISPDFNQLKRAMTGKTRQQINQASKNSLIALLGLEKLNEYYPIYSRAMHELGTPTLGLDFFISMAAHLPEAVELITLYHEEQIVGGGFIAPFKETLYCLWSGLLQEHYDLHTSYLLLWEAIKYAFEHGYGWVDMGRCRNNSGGYDFKKRFGGQAQQLYQQIYLNGIAQPPHVGAARKADVEYQYFVFLWRVLPQRVTEALGPKLRKRMPFG